MTPIQAFRFMQSKRLDFKALMILEQMNGYPSRVLTNQVVMDSMKEKISSPATTYKYISRLKKHKYIKDVRVKDQDERCHYIEITDTGRELIREWL
jgi:DNA-binding PadR family transcriptional regulator